MNDTSNQQEGLSQKVKTILVVEDDTAIGEFFIVTFQVVTPYQALLATNAEQALEIVKTLVPDLFILDYALPGINGLELYERLHAQEQLSHIPVLLMSANISEQELKKRSPVTFIAKPFDLDALLQKIDDMLL